MEGFSEWILTGSSCCCGLYLRRHGWRYSFRCKGLLDGFLACLQKGTVVHKSVGHGCCMVRDIVLREVGCDSVLVMSGSFGEDGLYWA